MHENCWLVRFRSILKCYSLWTKWVVKFFIFGSDDIHVINHSNFENENKFLNKSWWYLLKHVWFIIKLKDFCDTCVHLQWKKTNACRDTASADEHAWFAWQAPSLAKLRICDSENYVYSQIYNNNTRLQCARCVCSLGTWLMTTDGNQYSFTQGAIKVHVLSMKVSSPATLFAVEAHDVCVACELAYLIIQVSLHNHCWHAMISLCWYLYARTCISIREGG